MHYLIIVIFLLGIFQDSSGPNSFHLFPKSDTLEICEETEFLLFSLIKYMINEHGNHS